MSRSRVATALRAVGAVSLVLLALLFVAALRVMRMPAHPATDSLLVNDVTRLNPVRVGGYIAPATTTEIVEAIRAHSGSIAIGGGRFSMGGQTASDGALHIDMRRFNRIVYFEPAEKRIRIQAGTRWRQIQEHIDSAGLSVMIMQTYADFTVGGSLSVNSHGRYVGLGPVILSVESFEIVLADGSVVEASPGANPEIFYGAIGGYGGLGVITEVTLRLAENVAVKRRNRVMPITRYARFFEDSVRHSGAVFHNADIYPPAYSTVNAVSYDASDEPVTVPDRLIPADRPYRMNRFFFWVMSEWPFGRTIRRRILDPVLFRGRPVSRRNHEASYTVMELEPASREHSTYVLQEYFIPVSRFDEFVPRMRDVLRRNRVNAINVSIRHAAADPGSLLAWAPGEVFAFVLYYKQDTDSTARERVAEWTRELIDAALGSGGTYYLPYQLHATDEQFRRGYPRAHEFFALKRRLDPEFRFRNRLWDRYARGDTATFPTQP